MKRRKVNGYRKRGRRRGRHGIGRKKGREGKECKRVDIKVRKVKGDLDRLVRKNTKGKRNENEEITQLRK